MVMKHFHEKKIEAQKAAKASEMHQKRITGFIAKMVKTFWSNVEKVSFFLSIYELVTESMDIFLLCILLKPYT